VPATETVSALFTLPFAGGVTDDGLKPHDAPAGRPVHDRLTALAKPFDDVTVQVLLPLAPCCTLKLDGLHARLKFGGGGAVTVSETLAVRVVEPLTPETVTG
jgi:hypothetical protein